MPALSSDDAYDASIALHWYCAANYLGRDTRLGRIQSAIGYTPAPDEMGCPADCLTWYRRLLTGEISPTDLWAQISEWRSANQV